MASLEGGTGGASSLKLGRIHCWRAPSLHCSSCSPRVRSVTPTVGNSFMGWLRATMMRSSQGSRSRLWPRRRWMSPRRGSSPGLKVPATKRTRKSAPSSRKDRNRWSALGGMARSSSSSSVSRVPRARPLVKTHISSSGKAKAEGGMALTIFSMASRSEGLVRLMPQVARQGLPRVSSWGSRAPRMTRDCRRRRAAAQ